MKIVLVQPPVEDFYFTPHRSSVLGLLSLADVWTKKGHDCYILNFPLEKPLQKKIPLPDELKYLHPYLKSCGGTSYFSSYYRYGPSLESCVEKIRIMEAQVIAVSCFAWAYADMTQKLLKLLRKDPFFNSSLLVAGGPGASVMPEYFTLYADLVINGEGENAINVIEKRVPLNKLFQSGEIVNLKAPEKFPFVWNLKSKRKNRYLVTALLSRGCPKMCSFCANHLVFGKALRTIEINEVISGIDQLLETIRKESNFTELEKEGTGVNYRNIKLHINFEDDNILFRKSYFLSVLKYIKVKCDQNMIDFSFSAENGMDYLLLNTELLREFKALNLKQLNLSLASMDPEQLAGENRAGNLKKLEFILKISEKLDIPVITYFICGLKNDTPLKIVKTLIYLHNLKTSIGISHYYPVPGLADWQDRTIFWENPPFLCCGSSAYPWNRSLSTRELITAFRLARSSNYIKDNLHNVGIVLKLKYILLEDETMDKDMVELFFRII